MKKVKRTTSIGEKGAKLSKKLTLIFTFGAAALSLLLALVYQALIANFGTASAAVSVLSYIIEAFSVVTFFCFATGALYLLFSRQRGGFAYSLVMYGLSAIGVSVLANAGLVYLLSWLSEAVSLPFEISNYTRSFLEGAQLIYIISMSFFSVLSSFGILLVFSLAAAWLLKKYESAKVDLSLEALANENDYENPLRTPKILFTAIFAVISVGFQIYDTVQTVIRDGAPTVLSEYIYIVSPYFMLLVYTAAGYFAMQYYGVYLSKKMLEASKNR